MSRQHPQNAKAAEAKMLIVSRQTSNQTVRTISSAEEARQLYGWNLSPSTFEAVKLYEIKLRPAKYGRGVPPGEAFTLTDAQIREWRRR